MGAIYAFDIKQIHNKKNINIFFETGTFRGDAIQLALNTGFQTIYSVEIDNELALNAQERFKQYSNVHIINSDSITALNQILPTIQEPILFWLDAHFPGADIGKVPYDAEPDYNKRLPLETELDIILKHSNIYKDMIVCDDLWVYEDGNYESGSFDQHMFNHGHNVTRKQICGRTLDEIYKKYEPTHDIRKFYNHQGYVVFTKKDI